MEGAQPDQSAGRGRLQVAEERAEDPLQRTLALAYRYLNRRDRTVEEMRRHLEQRGCEPPAVDGTVALLSEQGYLDDARYARLFAQDKRTLEDWGSERIARALLSRGIDRKLIEEALDAAGPQGAETELNRAVALLSRRFSTALRARRERDGALGVLLRKGYDSEVALEALAVYNGLR